MTEPNAPQEPYTNPPGDTAPPPPPPPPPEAYGSQPPPQAYGSQPPPQGYSAPPTGGAPGPFSPLVGRQLTADEAQWGMFSHLGGIIGFLPSLIIMLTKGNESPYIKYNAVENLNFEITVAIAWFATIIIGFIPFLGLITILLWPAIFIGNLIFCILAGLAAQKGETYRYPVCLRLVK